MIMAGQDLGTGFSGNAYYDDYRAIGQQMEETFAADPALATRREDGIKKQVDK